MIQSEREQMTGEGTLKSEGGLVKRKFKGVDEEHVFDLVILEANPS